MALKLKLKPHEKAIINGAVIQNGPRPTEFIIKNFAQILREPEVMQQEDANTPAKRTYFAAQLMLLDPDNTVAHKALFASLISDLRGALSNADMLAHLAAAEAAVEQENYYQTLRQLRDVITYESKLLGPPAETAPPTEDGAGVSG